MSRLRSPPIMAPGKTQQEITAENSKQNTPGQLERTDSMYKRKTQIIFDVFY